VHSIVQRNYPITRKHYMLLNEPPKQTALRDAITAAYRQDETECVNNLISQAQLPNEALQRITETAHKLVIGTREHRKKQGGIDSFLHQYDLSSEEGIALMCLAEALLRIPDNTTVDRLISDKISTADWKQHLNKNNSLFINAATWSLLMTGKVYTGTLNNQISSRATINRLISRMGSTVIRPIIKQGMKIIGKQFVMGRTIDEAINRAKALEATGYRYSYDMLGEGARTQEDADKYFISYQNAIAAIGKAANGSGPMSGPGISIKLSALHPRYELAKKDRVMRELAPLLLKLAQLAKAQQISLTVDAEEADRLELSLDLIETVFSDASLNGWEGFGLAVQSYQKRAPFVLDWLADLAKRYQRRLMVRLIKGAYWDAEIKQSQVLGLEGYPVFTRKHSTDVSFLACAKKLLAQPESFYPMFGTHNAYSAAAVLEMAGTRKDFEFQCLHGMGQPLYDQMVGANNLNVPCRIYAPVGSHKDLLGYLVRRLLENGANTSFINLIADDNAPIEKIITNPVTRIADLTYKPHPHIPLPANIFGNERKNSGGIDLSNVHALDKLKIAMDHASTQKWESSPIINGKSITTSTAITVTSPINIQHVVGTAYKATLEDVETALTYAAKAAPSWANTPVEKRAAILENAAAILEKNMPLLMTLLCYEGGKHINDSVSEVREAIDFCHYYAMRARKDLTPQQLTGPTGEFNELSLHPRGVILCISPWNFPLAIFMGQVIAALASGNAVIAKPAEQTSLIATLAVRLLHEAGIPVDVLQLLPGRGSVIGAKCVADARIAGVMLTGSTETAQTINLTIANRPGPIIPLIAETGGQNAMIVDSSALPEQVVGDVLSSSFNSAGQRCSALRVLFLQEDIAPRVLDMLKGAMADLKLGDPSLLSTDIGPVIDQAAQQMLQDHFERMQKEAKLVYQVPTVNLPNGHFFAPSVFELKDLSLLQREVFGPILHVIRFKADELDQVLDQIINTGYGLTLGVHSRIDATVKHIQERMPVGNVYINRNMIGAVVGVQPFGGERLSGTGPKAGGPYYLPRLCVERAISINTTAAGGNATLVSLAETD
jgi:RHH-type proline utilization regulon transcriptional repressor/proline dehydrogenase/delta 1-pyrroline-5-carboxylate dehydrogenase